MVYFIFLRDAELSVCKSSCCEIEKRLELKLLILVWPAVYELLQFYGFYCRQDIRVQIIIVVVCQGAVRLAISDRLMFGFYLLNNHNKQNYKKIMSFVSLMN